MKRAVISLGSNVNLGPNLHQAIGILRRHPQIDVLQESSVYQSPAMGGDGDYPDFLNSAMLVETKLLPGELAASLKEIETEMGRIRAEDRFIPRTIDLDVVLYGEESVDEGDLRIPDPHIADYPFVAVPAAEVAADWVVAGDGRTVGDIAAGMDTSSLRRMAMTDVKEPGVLDEAFGQGDEVKVHNPVVENLIRELLVNIGEDPQRDGLARTPYRVARAMDYIMRGYTQDLSSVINNAVFESDTQDMVVLKDIEFYSMCEHHMLPFYGRAHVGYLPHGKVIGVSKMARLVDVFARRLQIQERLTDQIADSLMDCLAPLGVGVVMEAAHLCMLMRGVQKQNSFMVSSAMRGSFRTDARTRSEFMGLISGIHR